MLQRCYAEVWREALEELEADVTWHLFPLLCPLIQIRSLTMQRMTLSWGFLTSAPGLWRKWKTTRKLCLKWRSSNADQRCGGSWRRSQTASECHTITSPMVSERWRKGKCDRDCLDQGSAFWLCSIRFCLIVIQLPINPSSVGGAYRKGKQGWPLPHSQFKGLMCHKLHKMCLICVSMRVT